MQVSNVDISTVNRAFFAHKWICNLRKYMKALCECFLISACTNTLGNNVSMNEENQFNEDFSGVAQGALNVLFA